MTLRPVDGGGGGLIFALYGLATFLAIQRGILALDQALDRVAEESSQDEGRWPLFCHQCLLLLSMSAEPLFLALWRRDTLC